MISRFLILAAWQLPWASSAVASEYDLLFWSLVAICGVVSFGIACFVVYAAIRYHRHSDDQLPEQIQGNMRLEILWSAIPFVLFMGMFAWGATLYFDIERPPKNADVIYVIARQWMWKVQYLDGRREINELHVPVGRPVRLIMTSQDVIHSFYAPAFRIKQDVLPGRYTTIWFNPTKPGKQHLFCAEYCGTKHSGMIGWVYAMNPQDYRQWLSEGAAEGSLASTGEKYFHQFGCANCHHFDGHGPCPDLRGLYQRPVHLSDGRTVIADDSYLSESILYPAAKIVAGFSNLMPTFKGQLQEDEVVALIAFIKSIGAPPGAEEAFSPGSTPRMYGTQPGIAGPNTTGEAGTRPGAR